MSDVTSFGLERASATKFAFPFTYRMSVVYSDMHINWYVCRAVCGSVFFEREGIRLWWSVYRVNALPSIRSRKWRTPLKAARSSRS